MLCQWILEIIDLIDFRDNFSKTSGSLYQFCRDELNDNITDSESFKFKSKFLGKTNNENTINAKIAVPLKHLSNFWRTPEMSLLNCEINLILTYSANYVISERNSVTTFAITDTKLLCSCCNFINSG